MYRSNNFLAQCRRLSRAEPEHRQQELENLFLRSIPAGPRGFGLEIFSWAVQSERSRDPDQLHQLLADLVDLLWMQYDDEADPLEHDDWAMLRDVVDEHAQELELTLVQYIMERVLAHKAL